MVLLYIGIPGPQIYQYIRCPGNIFVLSLKQKLAFNLGILFAIKFWRFVVLSRRAFPLSVDGEGTFFLSLILCFLEKKRPKVIIVRSALYSLPPPTQEKIMNTRFFRNISDIGGRGHETGYR